MTDVISKFWDRFTDRANTSGQIITAQNGDQNLKYREASGRWDSNTSLLASKLDKNVSEITKIPWG